MSRNNLFYAALFVGILLFFAISASAEFATRTVPTSILSHKTYFDGLFKCSNAACTQSDTFSVSFEAKTSDGKPLNELIRPTKYHITWFLDDPEFKDMIVSQYDQSIDQKTLSNTHKVQLKKMYVAGTVLRFSAVVEYSYIHPNINTLITQPTMKFVYTQPNSGSTKYTSFATLFYTQQFYVSSKSDAQSKAKISAQLVYDPIWTNTYSLLATFKDIERETNKITIRPFGGLRSTEKKQLYCEVNSLDYSVTPQTDEMGDLYFQLTLREDYTAKKTFFFPVKIDLSLMCFLEMNLHNTRVPFGLSFAFNDRNEPNAEQSAVFMESAQMTIVNFDDKDVSEAKGLGSYDFYQSAYQPFYYHYDKDAVTYYRSHYSYFYIVYVNGNSVHFTPGQWFELYVQNTHNARHISTSWALSMEKATSEGTATSHIVLDRGTLVPTKTSATRMDFPTFTPKISNSYDGTSHALLLALDIQVEWDAYPPTLKNNAPQSINLILHQKVKKTPDAPITDWTNHVATSYPVSYPLVSHMDNFRVVPKKIIDKTNKDYRAYSVKISIQELTATVDSFSLILPSQQYLFKGSFTGCKLTWLNSATHTFETITVDGHDEKDMTMSDTHEGFIVQFEAPLIAKVSYVLECENGYLINSIKLSEKSFYNDHIPLAITAHATDETKHLNYYYTVDNIRFVDSLDPSGRQAGGHGLLFFFIIVVILAAIAAVVYKFRAKILSCFGGANASSSSAAEQYANSNDYFDSINTLPQQSGASTSASSSEPYVPPTFASEDQYESLT